MQHHTEGKLVILSAPSGSGKTTIMKEVVKKFPQLEFSISATSRQPRPNETHGTDYYFISAEEFLSSIEKGEFVEWEEVYAGTHYGTLRSEMERIWQRGNTIIFDVDVKGGLRLKEMFADNALAIFIMPPSIEELKNRLCNRGTETEHTLAKRIGKAEKEIKEASRFDLVVINDNLATAVSEVENAIEAFI